MADETELTAEEKAALIGKKVETDKEEIPDYEITEEGAEGTGDSPEEQDDKRAKKRTVEDDEDKRLGKSRDEHKQMSNREKRQLRKKRLAEKFDAKDTLIRQQQDQLNAMAARLNDVDGKLSQVDQESLQRAWSDTQALFLAAEKDHSDAFSTGDGIKATESMRKMYEAQKRLDELQAINARNQNVQPKQQGSKPDPVIVNRAQQWAKDNEWFRADGSDDDSAIANTIATRLVKEGYDPKSDDYWEELDDRLSTRGIGSDDEQQEQSQSQRERQDNKPARRKSPPVSGGAGRGDLGGGKQQITLPTAYIQTLKDNGYWDDPKVRNRMISRYQQGLKTREAEGR